MGEGLLLAQISDLDWPFNYLAFGILQTPMLISIGWFAWMVSRRRFKHWEVLAFTIFSGLAFCWGFWVWAH